MALLSERLVLTTTSASSASTKAVAVSSTKAVRTIEGRLSIQEEESHWNPQKEKSVGALPTRSRRRKIKKLL